jgi:tetratricopeptide (TPR) repeat protein
MNELDFLVSYAGIDQDWAEWIAFELESTGYSVHLRSWDILPGNNVVIETHRSICKARHVLAVLSPQYLAVGPQSEWAAALARDPTGTNRVLIPVRVRSCSIEGLWNAITYIDLIGLAEERARAVLLAGVGENVRMTRSPSPVPPESSVLFPGLFPSVWNISHRQNVNFTGREDVLGALESVLQSGRPSVPPQILWGLGGIGKTQIALEYLFRHLSDYELIWWLPAETPETLNSSYLALARAMGLPVDLDDPARSIAAVRRRLRENRRWLLIFDNAHDPRSIEQYLPEHSSGHILITTRNDTDWGSLGEPRAVTVWSEGEALEFLLKRTRLPESVNASELVHELGALPLALELAGAYIAEDQSFSRFLRAFRAHRRELLARQQPPTGYQATIATTWLVSLAEVGKAASEAIDLLHLVCFFASEDFLISDLEAGATNLPPRLAAALQDGRVHEEVLPALRQYSLISKRAGRISVHRLVQTVVRDEMSPDCASLWSKAALGCLLALWPEGGEEPDQWEICERLVPHALAAGENARGFWRGWERDHSFLFLRVAAYLRGRAEYGRAEEILARASAITPHVDAHGADLLNEMALTELAMGNLETSESLAREALELDRKIFDYEHPRIARDAGTLGCVLWAQNRSAEARDKFETAVDVLKKHRGNRGKEMALALTRLGATLVDEPGQVGRARGLFEQALAIDQEYSSGAHIARDRNNLGSLYWRLEERDKAVKNFGEALELDEDLFGEDHPVVARDRNNLGLMCLERGDAVTAMAHLKQALQTLSKALGSAHPEVLGTRKLVVSTEASLIISRIVLAAYMIIIFGVFKFKDYLISFLPLLVGILGGVGLAARHQKISNLKARMRISPSLSAGSSAKIGLVGDDQFIQAWNRRYLGWAVLSAMQSTAVRSLGGMSSGIWMFFDFGISFLVFAGFFSITPNLLTVDPRAHIVLGITTFFSFLSLGIYVESVGGDKVGIIGGAQIMVLSVAIWFLGAVRTRRTATKRMFVVGCGVVLLSLAELAVVLEYRARWYLSIGLLAGYGFGVGAVKHAETMVGSGEI